MKSAPTNPRDRAQSEQYWTQVAQSLRADGPAPVPAELAARAARAALDAPRKLSVSDAFFSLLGPAAGLGVAAVSLLVVVSLLRTENGPTADTAQSTAQNASLYSALVGGEDASDTLASRLLAPSAETP